MGETALNWPELLLNESPKIRALAKTLLSALDENERLRETVAAIQQNALAWHGDDAAKGRSLNVIAQWASMALNGRVHPDVVKITKSLEEE